MYEFGIPDKETGIKKINNHWWTTKKVEFHVEWDDKDHTWESYATVKECKVFKMWWTYQMQNLLSVLDGHASWITANQQFLAHFQILLVMVPSSTDVGISTMTPEVFDHIMITVTCQLCHI